MSENKTSDRTDSRWELVVTSKTMKLWAWGSAAVVMAVHIFMGLVVDVGDTGAQVTSIDVLAFPVLGPVSYTHLTLPTTPYV